MDRFDWLEIDDEIAATQSAQKEAPVRPQDGPTFAKAARRMRESGHFRSAVQFYEKALGFQPHDYACWVEMIDTLLRARQLEAADEKSQAALGDRGQVRVLYASRALVLAHQGQYREAQQHLEAAQDTTEPAWYAACVEAELLLRQDPTQRGPALACLERAADATKARWDVHFLAGWMLLDAKLPALAAGHFAEAGHWNPHAPLGWLCLGDCFQDLRLYDQAMFYYQRVTELEPGHALGLKRQKQCGGRMYGLLRVFRRENLRRRWNEEFE